MNTPKPAITLRDAYRFFVPLVFMTELNMISKSVIHAFLARTATPSVTLAAFNVSFTFYYTISSATEVTTYLSISFLRDKACLPRIVSFLVLILSLPLALALVVAFTPIGDWLYGTVFGASRPAVHEAKLATFVLTLSAPVLILRGVAFAVLMVNRRTLYITWSTLVRLLSLAGSLVILPLFLSGAVIGAAALVVCMCFETAFAWMLASGYYRALPASTGEPPPRLAELWRFAWPLILNQASEMGVVFVINLFIGRLANADLALAAFGVVHGLVSLLFSPMRNLVQTAQTLVASRSDARVLGLFTLQLAGFFAAVAVILFYTPLENWVLGSVMGLTPELGIREYPGLASRLRHGLLLGDRRILSRPTRRRPQHENAGSERRPARAGGRRARQRDDLLSAFERCAARSGGLDTRVCGRVRTARLAPAPPAVRLIGDIRHGMGCWLLDGRRSCSESVDGKLE